MIELQIITYNYWEHFKAAKELAFVLPLNHPKRIMVEKELNILIDKMNELKLIATQK